MTNPAQHPIPVGTWILSLNGEQDEIDPSEYEDEFGPTIRQTGPKAIGHILFARDLSDNGQGWSYAVVFPNGTWVNIDQADGIDDPAKYRVLYAD